MPTSMKNLKSSNLTSFSAIAAGILLVLAGTAAIGYYILVLIEALDNVDKSGVFWLLPLAFIGTFLVLTGIYFLLIGFKSREDKKYQRTAFVSVIVLGACTILLLAGLYTSESAADKIRQDVNREEAMIQELQRLTALSIMEANTEGLTISFTTHGAHTGNYHLQLRVYNSRNQFWESQSTIDLKQDTNDFTRYILFDEIFHKCSGEFKNSSSVYVCVNNAGTSNSKFALAAKLSPDDFDSNNMPGSKAETSFYLDTFTENDTVIVQKVVIE